MGGQCRGGVGGGVLVPGEVKQCRTVLTCSSGPGRAQPVGVALEGIRGQLRRAVAVAVGDVAGGGPVNGVAAGMESGGGEQKLTQVAFVAAQSALYVHPAFRDGVGGLLDADGQDGMGAALDEVGVPVVEQSLSGGGELHGPAQVGVPVPPVELGGGGDLRAGYRRVVGDRAGLPLLRLNSGQQIGQFSLQDLHVCGVGGVVDRDGTGPDTGGLTVGEDFPQGVGVARDDGRGGAVVRGHRQPALVRSDQLTGRLAVHGEGEHPAVPGGQGTDRP